MKRRRFIYGCRGFFETIDSDDPRVNNCGLIRAAMIYGDRVAKREFGPRGELLDIDVPQGRQKSRQDKRQTAWQNYQIRIGIRMGCGIHEEIETELAMRIGNPHNNRRYFEQPPLSAREHHAENDHHQIHTHRRGSGPRHDP